MVDYVIIRAIYCAVCVNVQGDARILVVLTDAPPTFVDDRQVECRVCGGDLVNPGNLMHRCFC